MFHLYVDAKSKDNLYDSCGVTKLLGIKWQLKGPQNFQRGWPGFNLAALHTQISATLRGGGDFYGARFLSKVAQVPLPDDDYSVVPRFCSLKIWLFSVAKLKS